MKNIFHFLKAISLVLVITLIGCNGDNRPANPENPMQEQQAENPAKVHLDWMWSEKIPCTEKGCMECVVTEAASGSLTRGSHSAHDCIVEAKKATDAKVAENWLLCAQSHNPAAQQIIKDEIQWCLEYIKSLN